MDDNKLLQLVLLCIPLSLVSFGGGQPIIAGLQQETVETYAFLSADKFTEFYAIARAAPGPGTLIVALIGWHIDGLLGALCATLAIFVPSSIVVCLVGTIWRRHRGSPWAVATERGLLPVATGLVFAGAYTLTRSANLSILEMSTVAFATCALLYTRIGAYPLLGMAAASFFILSFWGWI